MCVHAAVVMPIELFKNKYAIILFAAITVVRPAISIVVSSSVYERAVYCYSIRV